MTLRACDPLHKM